MISRTPPPPTTTSVVAANLCGRGENSNNMRSLRRTTRFASRYRFRRWNLAMVLVCFMVFSGHRQQKDGSSTASPHQGRGSVSLFAEAVSVAVVGVSLNGDEEEDADEAKKAERSLSSSSSSSSSAPPTLSIGEIFRKAGRKALGGGLPGAAAGVVQVFTLMWLRTTINYQCRYGSSFF